jgi:hypothetical protein
MCSNKFAEWWQSGTHGWPIEPQCAEYTLAREAFSQGWSAAQAAPPAQATADTGIPKLPPENMDADELARKYNKCKCGGELIVEEWRCVECGNFIGNP